MNYYLSLERKTETDARSRVTPAIVTVVSIILAFALAAIFLAAYGHNPLEVYAAMFMGAFGRAYGFSETLVKAIPIALCGLAVSVAFRMQLWNIGAEGQLYMGAFAASGLALFWGDMSPLVLLPLMLVAGFVAGAVWGAIPGALKAYLGANETITTLMLNYVAILWVDYLVYGPWKDPKGYNFPLSAIFPDNAWLPVIFGHRVHIGLILAIIVAIVLYYVMKYSRFGYEVRVIGQSRAAASYSGMNVTRNILLVMIISGGIAGIAGMVEAAGVAHRLQYALSPGYGYTAIIIAWLSRLNPIAILPVSLLFGGLLVGGFSVQTTGIPSSIVQMLQGALLFFLIGGELFNRYRIRVRRKEAA